MTPDDWKYVESALSFPLGAVVLQCDEHLIKLRVEPIAELKYAIAVYVDGWIRGEWMSRECDISTRFYRRCERSAFSQKEKAAWRKFYKALGKPDQGNRKIITFAPYWNTVASLRRHFIKHNTSIELVREEV